MHTETQKKTVAIVRAIPVAPHKRRWCGAERWVPDETNRPQQETVVRPDGKLHPVFDEAGRKIYAKHALPWTGTEVRVYVVDRPEPYDPDKNGGAPQEISPATLAMLQRDERIAVRVEGEVDAGEVVAIKDALRKKDLELEQLRQELAMSAENASTFRGVSTKQTEDQGARISTLEQELAAARAQLAKKGK